MDFLGIIQWVMDVQQYPESHKEEIERLKGECANLSNLITMIGEEELPNDLKMQIKRNLDEAEDLLRKVPRKAGIVQSFISMLPGQQVLQKLKDASDNIHRTVNNVNTWMNCRIFSKKLSDSAGTAPNNVAGSASDLSSSMRLSKVKKVNSANDQVSDDTMLISTRRVASAEQFGATLVEGLDPTYVNDNDEGDDDELFAKKRELKTSFELDKNGNIYDIFEQYTVNTRETISVPLQSKVFFTFQRATYHAMSEAFKDVNRISRDHANLQLIYVEGASEFETTAKEEKKNAKKQPVFKTAGENLKEAEDNFATCEEGFAIDNKQEEDDEEKMFGSGGEKKQQPQEEQYHCVIECLGANGISVYRKRENEEKQKAVLSNTTHKLKVIQPGQWVDVAKGEKALLFNNDSFALLRKEKITISYTFKIA